MEIFDLGKDSFFIWASYGVSAAAFLYIAIKSRRDLKTAQAEAERLNPRKTAEKSA